MSKTSLLPLKFQDCRMQTVLHQTHTYKMKLIIFNLIYALFYKLQMHTLLPFTLQIRDIE